MNSNPNIRIRPADIAVCTLPEMQYIISQVTPHSSTNTRNNLRKCFQMNTSRCFIQSIRYFSLPHLLIGLAFLFCLQYLWFVLHHNNYSKQNHLLLAFHTSYNTYRAIFFRFLLLNLLFIFIKFLFEYLFIRIFVKDVSSIILYKISTNYSH